MMPPRLIVGLLVAQVLQAVLLAVLSIYVLTLIRSPEIRSAHGAAPGLLIGGSVFGVPALLMFAACLGLWKRRRWGWWLALLADTVMFLMLAYSLYDDGWRNLDLESTGLSAVSAVVLAYLLLPGVRAFYRTPVPGNTSPNPGVV